MIPHLSKMACGITIWYWQTSIPDFYLLRKALSQIISTTRTLPFQIYLAFSDCGAL